MPVNLIKHYKQWLIFHDLNHLAFKLANRRAKILIGGKVYEAKFSTKIVFFDNICK